jgi:ABC-type phosphate transport system substrate-binding protein
LKIFLGLIFIATLLPIHRARPAEEHLFFIVNEANPVHELTTKQIADFYYKKNRYWENGTKVRFFDHRSSSAERILFLKQILKKTSRDVDLFWIEEKNSSGQGAPLEAPSDDLIASSVASLLGAIGYITDETTDLTGVKKVPVRDQE